MEGKGGQGRRGPQREKTGATGKDEWVTTTHTKTTWSQAEALQDHQKPLFSGIPALCPQTLYSLSPEIMEEAWGFGSQKNSGWSPSPIAVCCLCDLK